MELYPNSFHHKRENSAFIPPHTNSTCSYLHYTFTFIVYTVIMKTQNNFSKNQTFIFPTRFQHFFGNNCRFCSFFLRLASKSVGRGKLSGAIGEECIYSSLKLLVKNQYILSNSRSRYRPSRVGVSLSLCNIAISELFVSPCEVL